MYSPARDHSTSHEQVEIFPGHDRARFWEFATGSSGLYQFVIPENIYSLQYRSGRSRPSKATLADGTNTPPSEKAKRVARSMYDWLCGFSAAYNHERASHYSDGQYVRTATQCFLEGDGATCLDVALALASALDEYGVHSIDALYDDHCVAGFWTDRFDVHPGTQRLGFPDGVCSNHDVIRDEVESDRLVLIEATGLLRLATRETLPSPLLEDEALVRPGPLKWQHALDQGRRWATNPPPRPFRDAIDVRLRRQALADRRRASSLRPAHVLLPTAAELYFRDRVGDVDKLSRLLLSSDVDPRVAIVGFGGIGKTQLARRVIDELQHQSPRPVIQVQVDRRPSKDVHEQMAAMLRLLCQPPRCIPANWHDRHSDFVESVRRYNEGGDAAVYWLPEILQSYPLLVLLDNIERADSVRPLFFLEDQSLRPFESRFILTSRTRPIAADLLLPHDSIWTLSAGLPLEHSREVVTYFAGAAASRNRSALDYIIGQVSGFPPALKIIGRLLCSGKNVSRLARTMEAAGAALPLLEQSDCDRVMRKVLDECIETLTADAISFFECIAFCDINGFTVEAAIAASGIAVHDAELLVEELAERMFIQPLQPSDQYCMHPVIRQYARGRVKERKQQTEVENRFADRMLKDLAKRLVDRPALRSYLDRNQADLIFSVKVMARRTGSIDPAILEIMHDIKEMGFDQLADELRNTLK